MHTTSSIDDTINEDHGDNTEREQNHNNTSSLLHKDVKKGFAAMGVDENTDQAKSPTGDDLLNNVDHLHHQLHDELADSDDDVGPAVKE